MAQREPAVTDDPTIGKLVVDASRDVSSLIRSEIALAKSELRVSAKAGGISIGLFGAAAFLILLAIIMFSVALAYFLHMTGPAYAVGAAAGGIGLLWLAISFARQRLDDRARLLFLGSITYLPLLWGMLIVDRL